jgi:hypothetical protein
MKSLTLLLVICVAAAVPTVQADGQPSLAAIRAACTEDAQKLCAGVQPGGGRIVACLKEHKDSLSDRCKQAAGLAASPSSSPAPSATGSSVVTLRGWAGNLDSDDQRTVNTLRQTPGGIPHLRSEFARRNWIVESLSADGVTP